jgi:hypothetical protein
MVTPALLIFLFPEIPFGLKSKEPVATTGALNAFLTTVLPEKSLQKAKKSTNKTVYPQFNVYKVHFKYFPYIATLFKHLNCLYVFYEFSIAVPTCRRIQQKSGLFFNGICHSPTA